MAPETFPFFTRLPAELRVQIYLLSTPPRFIHIQERTLEDWDSFQENFSRIPLLANLQLHPSISYFAHEWRHTIPTGRNSRDTSHLHPGYNTLEHYGFTSSKPIYQPWPPTQKCPEIPLHTLIDRCDLVWELTRKSYLFSAAPIPAFLHVNTESRRFLEEYGYKLSFSTRTHGPRIWFCSKDDIVYLRRVHESDELGTMMLTREPWGLGVFMPDDLKRVRRVALEGVDINANYGYHEGEVSKVMALFGGVDELFLVDHNLDFLLKEAWKSMRRWWRGKMEMEKEEVFREGRFWGWVECDEADALSKEEFVDYWGVFRTYFAGEESWRLKDYKRKHEGDASGFFEGLASDLEKELKDRKDEIVGEERIAPWEIPSVRIVHVGTMGKMKRLFEMRARYWRAVEEKELEELENGVPMAERIYITQRPLSPFSLNWQEDLEALDHANYDYYSSY